MNGITTVVKRLRVFGKRIRECLRKLIERLNTSVKRKEVNRSLYTTDAFFVLFISIYKFLNNFPRAIIMRGHWVWEAVNECISRYANIIKVDITRSTAHDMNRLYNTWTDEQKFITKNSVPGNPFLIARGANGLKRFTDTKNVSGVCEFSFWLMDNIKLVAIWQLNVVTRRGFS